MMFPEINFEPKGPDGIRGRMNEIRSRLEAGQREEFQAQLDQATRAKFDGTPAPLSGKIGGLANGGDEKLGTLPPANPSDFEVGLAGPQATKMQIQATILQVAREQNMDPNLLRAVVDAESGFNPNETSKTGAMGLMQLMPDTARSVGVANVLNPYQNLTGGAKYLNQMIKRYDGNVALALAAYNAGPGKVDKARGIPNIPETQKYVNRIMTQVAKQ